MGQIWYQPPREHESGGGDGGGDGGHHHHAGPEAFVDFNTKHVCRKFEHLRAWAFARQIREPTPRDFLRPPRKGDKVYREIP